MAEDEMVGWHPQHNELEQTLGDSEGQGILVYCSPWSCKQSDTTELLNSNNKGEADSLIKHKMKQTPGLGMGDWLQPGFANNSLNDPE